MPPAPSSASLRALCHPNQEPALNHHTPIRRAAMLDRGEVDMEAAQLQIEHFWAGALRRAVIDGDVDGGSLMAGQSVGMVKAEEPVADIIAQLMEECEAALSRR